MLRFLLAFLLFVGAVDTCNASNIIQACRIMLARILPTPKGFEYSRTLFGKHFHRESPISSNLEFNQRKLYDEVVAAGKKLIEETVEPGPFRSQTVKGLVPKPFQVMLILNPKGSTRKADYHTHEDNQLVSNIQLSPNAQAIQFNSWGKEFPPEIPFRWIHFEGNVWHRIPPERSEISPESQEDAYRFSIVIAH